MSTLAGRVLSDEATWSALILIWSSRHLQSVNSLCYHPLHVNYNIRRQLAVLISDTQAQITKLQVFISTKQHWNYFTIFSGCIPTLLHQPYLTMSVGEWRKLNVKVYLYDLSITLTRLSWGPSISTAHLQQRSGRNDCCHVIEGRHFGINTHRPVW